MRFRIHFLYLVSLGSFLNACILLWITSLEFVDLLSLSCNNLFFFARDDGLQSKETALVFDFDRPTFLRQQGRLSQPAVPTHQQYKIMERQSKNNRSLLAMAGQNSIISKSSKQNFKPSPPNYKSLSKEFSILPTAVRIEPFQSASIFDPKQIIKKLGLGRLRKMQALVRGFLVRRKVYPKELEQYLVAESAMNLVIANVIYREVSGIVVESISLGHYDQKEGGQARMLEEYLYNLIVKRVIEQEFLPIARQAVYETAIYASRPEITFGFNLRDPLELALFLKINSIVEEQCRQIATQALKEEAVARREMQIIDDLIQSMGLVSGLCEQIVNQCLLQGIEDYEAEDILQRMVKEGARVIAEVVYNEELARIQDKHVQELSEQAEEWLLQECILNLIISDPNKQQSVVELPQFPTET